MNRLEDPEEEQLSAADGLCRKVNECVAERPGTSVAVTLGVGVAAGLLLSGMACDVIRSAQRRSTFDSVRLNVADALKGVIPKDLADRLS